MPTGRWWCCHAPQEGSCGLLFHYSPPLRALKKHLPLNKKPSKLHKTPCCSNRGNLMHLCVFASHWSVGDSLSSQLSRPIRVFLALAPPLKSSRARETKCCLHSVLGMTHWDNVDRHQCQCTAWRLDWECGAADVNLCSNIYSGYSGIVGFFFFILS